MPVKDKGIDRECPDSDALLMPLKGEGDGEGELGRKNFIPISQFSPQGR